MKSAISV